MENSLVAAVYIYQKRWTFDNEYRYHEPIEKLFVSNLNCCHEVKLAGEWQQ